MNPERLGFMRAICENPADDLPRLIYADYLDERGDPLGEFIRLSCAIARGSRVCADCEDGKTEAAELCPNTTGCAAWLNRRAGELFKAHRETWAPTDLLIPYKIFRRGFVAEVRCSAENWLVRADELTTAYPIERLTLTTTPPDSLALEQLRAKWPRIEVALSLGYRDYSFRPWFSTSYAVPVSPDSEPIDAADLVTVSRGTDGRYTARRWRRGDGPATGIATQRPLGDPPFVAYTPAGTL